MSSEGGSRLRPESPLSSETSSPGPRTVVRWVQTLNPTADSADVTKAWRTPIRPTGDRSEPTAPGFAQARHRSPESDVLDELDDTVAIGAGASRYGRHAAPTAGLPSLSEREGPVDQGRAGSVADLCEAESAPDHRADVSNPAEREPRPRDVTARPTGGVSARVLRVFVRGRRPSGRGLGASPA